MTNEEISDKKNLQIKAALGAAIAVIVILLSWFFLFNSAPSGIERDDHRFTISLSQWPEDWRNMDRVLIQAKAEKIENPDGTLSFRMTNIDPKGMFAALGVEEEDIIQSINNKPIYDMQEVLSLVGTVDKDMTIELGLKRGEQEEVLVYKLIQ